MAKNIAKLQKKAVEQAAKGNYAKAIKLYQELYEANPEDTRTWLKMAELYRKLGQRDNAIDFYQKVAALYALQGRLLPAIGVNKIILEIDPEHTQTQEAIAALYAQRDSQEAKPAKEETAPVKSVVELLKRRGPVLRFERERRADIEDIKGPTLDTAAAAAGLPETLAIPAPAASASVEENEDIDRMLDMFVANAVIVPQPKTAKDLPRIPLFSSLDAEQFVAVVGSAKLHVFDDGHEVVREGGRGDSIFIIVSGKASVSKSAPGGKQTQLAILEDGTFFGELSYFRGAARTASVHAKGRLEVLELTREKIDVLIQQYPNVKRRLLYHYHQRMLDTVLQISPLFASLAAEELDEARRQLEYVEAAPDEVLIEQGKQASGLFVIARGQVVPASKTPDGATLAYPTMQDGDFFGEISLISRSQATATCTAIEPTALYKMSREAFNRLLAELPTFAATASEVAEVRSQRSQAMRDAEKTKGMSAHGMI